MSAIDPSTIDPTKPENYPATALSQDQRDNWAATQAQLTTARDEMTAVEAHVATVTGNPHALDATDVGADPAGTAAAAVAAHEAAGDPHPVYLTPVEGDGRYDPLGAAAAAVTAHEADSDPHPVYLTQAEGDVLYEPVGALRNVADDTSPKLGGELGTEGFAIFLRRSDLSDRGVVVALDTLDGSGFLYTRDGSYSVDDGGITVEPSRVRLWGTGAVVEGLKHTTAGGRPAYVSEDGSLFTVDPPTAGWTRTDTSIATADLGSGTTAGPWADTDLTLAIGDDVEIGQRLDVSVSLHIENLTNRSGSISVGFGFNGAQPTSPSATISVGAYFSGWVPVSFSTTAGSPLTTADDIDVFVRRETGEHAAFNPFLQYEGTIPHEGLLSTPGTGGGGVAGVSSFNGRSGAVTSQAGDYDAGQVGADPAGTAAAAVTAHEGAADPHPLYLTVAEGDAAYDPIGSAAAAVAAHEAAGDPHPVYLTAAADITSQRIVVGSDGTRVVEEAARLEWSDAPGNDELIIGAPGSTKAVTTLFLRHTAPNNGAFFQNTGTAFAIGKKDDDGANEVDLITVDRATGNLTSQIGVFKQQSVPLMHPTSVAAKTGTFQPNFDGSETPRYYVNSSVTITAPDVSGAGDDGMAEVILGPSAAVTASGFTAVMGSRDDTKHQLAYITADKTAAVTYFVYGSASA